ncbi:cupredoxin domain-containing protein [Thalassolituus sp. C2-1]|uniref:cupredoxin domain-containing protein n=1 Tax=Venatorbacter sp. C2-1 TaxID=2597518 RepID=UPI001FB8B332|nr:cupredoxin domain-containing protein [Thalassolituus sp. C2-1]
MMILINLAGLAFIALIVWWFWLYQPPQTTLANDELLIIVENGTYQPARIRLPANQPVSLNFLRKDASPCSEVLLIPDLHISDTLPLNKRKRIDLPPMSKGDYAFHCQMQMYRGQLTVE